MPISRRKVVGGTLGLLTTSATSAQKKETPPRRLSEILPKLAWDGAKRGPLLIVDAFMTFSVAPYYWEKFTQRAVPSPQNGMLYTLGEIEVIFGRQPLFYNGLTVLAPTTMVQLSTRLQDADITDSNLAPKTAHRLLVAQMTSAQRHQLSSTGGFGLSNCSDEAQKRLFLLAIPNPFLDAKGKLLSEAERRQIHLQAFRSAKIMPLIEGGTLFDSSLVASHVATRSTNADYQRESAFGQSIRQIVPATNKRSGLSYDRPELDRLIPLGEVKTVQELVERVAKASGLELYADARMGRLKVSLLATPQARTSAGVLLKALARAVTGTFRQVGGAYVLTDDLIGYGTRAGWIGEWLMEADAAQWDMMTKAESALAQSQSWQDFGYDPRLGFSLSPQQEKLWREQMLLPWEERRKKHGIFGIHFTAKELTAAQLSSLAPQIKQIEEEVSTPSKPRTIERDRVSVKLELKLSYILPSKEIVGEQWDMDALSLMTTPEVTAPKPPPRQWPQLVGKSATRRIWLIALPTLEEVSGLIELAAQKKFGLCLEVPTELPWEEVKKRFEAALAEGNRKNVGVGAVLRLLRAASGMAGSALNQLGETGSVAGRRLIKQATMAERQPVVLDWLEPKHPLVAERLQKVADLPGLSQLLLTDTLYPIFSIKQEEATPGFARPVGAAFSYNCSVEERLAFLRAENMDPLDIAQTETFTVNLKLPWLNDHYEDELLERRWNDWRYQRNADSLQPFHALLQRTAPSLPVLVLDRSPHERFFALWEKPQLLPRANTTYLQPETLKTARSQSRDLWRRMSYRPNHSLGEHFKVKVVPDSTAGLVATVEQELRIGGTSDKAASWDGVALDLRLFPLQDALRLLKPLVTE